MELGYSAMHRSIHAQPVVATQATCTEVLTGVAVWLHPAGCFDLPVIHVTCTGGFVESQFRRTGFITLEYPVQVDAIAFF